MRSEQGLRRVVSTVIAVLSLSSSTSMTTAWQATPISSADAAEALTSLLYGPGVIFRAPENCESEASAPYDDPAILAYCAVKDVVGALGGPSSGAGPADFVEAPYRYEFEQPIDCEAVGAVADGKHDNCAVVTGAATLLRAGLPVRLFGVCDEPVPMDCALLGTITDPDWKPAGVYLLMDPARMTIRCQYAQDADRNGCNEGGAYTAGQVRPLCSEVATNPMCQFGADEQEQMLAAYAASCTREAETCRENQVEGQWDVDAVIAIGYMNRGDQAWDCGGSRAMAERFAEAVNTTWPMNIPTVQVFIDVAGNQVQFGDSVVGCAPIPPGT